MFGRRVTQKILDHQHADDSQQEPAEQSYVGYTVGQPASYRRVIHQGRDGDPHTQGPYRDDHRHPAAGRLPLPARGGQHGDQKGQPAARSDDFKQCHYRAGRLVLPEQFSRCPGPQGCRCGGEYQPGADWPATPADAHKNCKRKEGKRRREMT